MEPHDTPGTPSELEPIGTEPAAPDPTTADPGTSATTSDPGNMLPRRSQRRFGLERLLVRVIATCGIVGIGVLLGAILVSQKVQGWIVGLVIAIVTVVLSGLLWSSRQL